MEKYYRIVLDLYKQCFNDYVNKLPVNVDAVSEAQKCLNFAIDRAKINNEPCNELEDLKRDLNALKYDLL